MERSIDLKSYEILKMRTSTVFGKIVFDIGANVGNKAAEYLANGAEKVVCFEPQQNLVTELSARFADEKRVIVLPYALGPEEGTMKLYPSNANTIATMSEKFQTGRFKTQGYVWYEPIDVQVKTVGDMINLYGVPDYMKIDVEGFEYSVLLGLKDNFPKVISVEYSEEFSDEYEKILIFLESKGYTKFTVSLGESGEFQLIWGSRQDLLNYFSCIHTGQYSWGDIYAMRDDYPRLADHSRQQELKVPQESRRLCTYGDSHSNIPFFDIDDITRIWIGPKTMYSMGKNGITLPEYINSNDTVIFSFGELDCRCFVHKQVINTKRSPIKVINELVVNLMRQIVKCRVVPCIMSITPPVKNHGHINYGEYPYVGTVEEINQYTVIMNNELKSQCKQHNIIYLDFYQYYSDSAGYLKPELSDNNVHIGNSVFIQHELHRYGLLPALPRVSVIIPTYNRVSCLKNAIASVLKQDYPGHIETIVVDDCSPGEESKTLPSLPYPVFNRSVKFLRTPYNTGCPAAPRNIGLAETKNSDYIALLDDDDTFLPTKIREQVKAMVDEKSEISATEALFSNEDISPIDGKTYIWYYRDKYRDFLAQHGITSLRKYLTFDDIDSHNWIVTSTVMIKRSLIDRVGLFVKGDKNSSGWEDWDYWKRCGKVTNILQINNTLSFYNACLTDKWHNQILGVHRKRKNIFSRNGEDGILPEMLVKLPINKWAVEVGARDGKKYSSFYNLINNSSDWKCISIEADDTQYQNLLVTCSENPGQMFPLKTKIDDTYNKLDNVLQAYGNLPVDFDILSIHTKSGNNKIWASVEKYKPKIVVFDINGDSNILIDIGKQKGYKYFMLYENLVIFIDYKYYRLFGGV